MLGKIKQRKSKLLRMCVLVWYLRTMDYTVRRVLGANCFWAKAGDFTIGENYCTSSNSYKVICEVKCFPWWAIVVYFRNFTRCSYCTIFSEPWWEGSLIKFYCTVLYSFLKANTNTVLFSLFGKVFEFRRPNVFVEKKKAFSQTPKACENNGKEREAQ